MTFVLPNDDATLTRHLWSSDGLADVLGATIARFARRTDIEIAGIVDIEHLAADEGMSLRRARTVQADDFTVQCSMELGDSGLIRVRFGNPPPDDAAEQIAGADVDSPVRRHGWLSCARAGDIGWIGNLASEIGWQLWRYERAWAWAKERSHTQWLVGESADIVDLQRVMSVAAKTDLPVHVVRPSGSPSSLVAHGIHASSSLAAGPFVEVDARMFALSPAKLAEIMAGARGGTLVINDLGRFPISEVPRLLQYRSGTPGTPLRMSGRVAGDRAPAATAAPTTRLIMIDEIEQRTAALCDALDSLFADHGGVLTVRVPPLRHRVEDLDALLARLWKRYAANPDSLTRECVQAFESMVDSTADERAIEHAVARLVARNTEGPFSETDVQQACADAPAAVQIERIPAMTTPMDPSGSDPVAAAVLDGRLDHSLHEAVRAALAWAVEHHAADISTPNAAAAAHVSSSHLSHLLKAELGTSFRLLLARIRIERARRLLASKPERTVTDISLDVGFGDLSHFIKSFSRFTGVTPREYRRRVLALNPPLNATKAAPLEIELT